jgi:hypothetical protein
MAVEDVQEEINQEIIEKEADQPPKDQVVQNPVDRMLSHVAEQKEALL